jgi:hypothetical protein
MRRKKKTHPTVELPKKGPRNERVVAHLSKDEKQMIDNYLAKYHITNRSRWIRETLLRSIIQNLELDYPTLFAEHDMRR